MAALFCVFEAFLVESTIPQEGIVKFNAAGWKGCAVEG